MLTLCEGLDQLITIELVPPHFPRGIARRLYRAARPDGDPPLTYQIIEALREQKARGKSRIALVTGFWHPEHFPNGENDGCIGATALGWGLANLGWRPAVLTEPEIAGPLRSLVKTIKADVLVLKLSRHDEAANTRLAQQFDSAIFVEKVGSSRAGVFHSVLGYDLGKDSAAELQGFVDAMHADDKLTIGIGDGGNEVGFGRIFEEARRIVPWGAECRCPEKDGIVTRTATRLLLPTGVSNWGAYAIYAGLNASEGLSAPLYSPEIEAKLIDRCVELNIRDGGTGVARRCVDGIPARYCAALVELMNGMVQALFTKEERDF